MPTTTTSNRTTSENATQWLRRVGAAGIAFFLVKGLAWLVVPFVVARFW